MFVMAPKNIVFWEKVVQTLEKKKKMHMKFEILEYAKKRL